MKTLQVGMLIPWVNTAMEEEIPALVHPDIGLHWSRLRPFILPINGHDTSYLESMLAAVPDALSKFDGLNLHIIVLGCTSASLACSSISVPETYRQSKFITAFDAIIIQLNKIAARRVLLFAPYDKRTLAAEVELLKSGGFEVIKSIPLGYNNEIRYISTEKIYSIFVREYTADCDVVLFSCTALYTSEIIDNIKKRLDLKTPLLSSNTAIAQTLTDFFYQNCGDILKHN